jgi:hypothetical protein
MRESFRACGSKLPGGSCLIIIGTEGTYRCLTPQHKDIAGGVLAERGRVRGEGR